MTLNYHNKHLTISTDKSKLDIELIQQNLDSTYWAKGISKETIQKSIDNCLSYGIYENDKQVGFARVITDYSTFAYLSDVFIAPTHQKLGLSIWLIESILKHPDLQSLRRFVLLTKDAHELYKKFGFEKPKHPEEFMERT